MTEQELQNYYNQSEIDYARILLMNEVDILDMNSPMLHVNDSLDIHHSTFATALGNFGFIRNLNLTLLRFEYGDTTSLDSINIYYRPHGDGHITTYQLAEVDLLLDRYADEMEKEVLATAETVYVEPSEAYLIADFIKRVEFVYE